MEQVPTPLEALEEAVRRAGSQSELARICGVGQPAIWKMLQSSKRLGHQYCLAVEAATGVSRHYLRPDIYPITAGMRLKPMSQTVPARKAAPRRRRRLVAVVHG